MACEQSRMSALCGHGLSVSDERESDGTAGSGREVGMEVELEFEFEFELEG